MEEEGVTLVIGGAGAIGKALIPALVERYGPQSVVCALHRTSLPEAMANQVISEFGVDIRDKDSLSQVLEKYAGKLRCVWNLAAPLSVETAKDPTLAEQITVGGMRNLLSAIFETNQAAGGGDSAPSLPRVCFTDSIGSYGAAAPRDAVAAAWLVEHPDQDPGSDYGRQKRACRELLRDAATGAHGGAHVQKLDCRWCVVPGVLHAEESWGAGTTEYALDALLCAVEGTVFEAPIPVSTQLPMIYVADLVEGLVALMEAPAEALREPENGYCLAGFSFSATELFAEIRKYVPGFEWSEDEAHIEPNAAMFASLWPDSISAAEAARDLSFAATNDMASTVRMVLEAHAKRRSKPNL